MDVKTGLLVTLVIPLMELRPDPIGEVKKNF